MRESTYVFSPFRLPEKARRVADKGQIKGARDETYSAHRRHRRRGIIRDWRDGGSARCPSCTLYAERARLRTPSNHHVYAAHEAHDRVDASVRCEASGIRVSTEQRAVAAASGGVPGWLGGA